MEHVCRAGTASNTRRDGEDMRWPWRSFHSNLSPIDGFRTVPAGLACIKRPRHSGRTILTPGARETTRGTAAQSEMALAHFERDMHEFAQSEPGPSPTAPQFRVVMRARLQRGLCSSHVSGLSSSINTAVSARAQHSQNRASTRRKISAEWVQSRGAPQVRGDAMIVQRASTNHTKPI